MTVLEEYVYDHAERLLFQTHKVNGLAEVVIFENVYDELGALEKKRIGGKHSGTTPTASTFLQELQYKYNIRGWLTEVNNASNINQVNNGKSSLFALKLNYNKPEQGITGVKPLYNGNISEQIWTSAIDNKKRGYGYVYDGVNRLVLGSFKAPDLNSASTASLFDEKLEYDKNGNILKLDRNGASLAGVTTVIDKLTYGYESGSNRLSTVRDASGNQEGFKQVNTAGADYAYDEFGNLISDKHKKITKIKYNHLNLPVEINFGADKIEYLYTASGEKTQKKVTEKGVVTLTDYLGGFQYVKGKLSFLPTTEGFFNVETNAYVYQYKDHLGNVRLSYSDKSGDNTIQSSSEIIEETNYYPFGLAHKGYNQKNDALMKDYKYKYNGKELQDELGLNVYDYGARTYMPDLGRWMQSDPLINDLDFTFNPNDIDEDDPTQVEIAYHTTLGNGGGIYNRDNLNPYAYGYNEPVRFDDPDGRCPNCFTAIAGALIGGGIELGGQLLSGKSLGEVDWADVGVEALKGGLIGSGVSAGAAAAIEGGAVVVKASFDYTANEKGKSIFNGKKSGKEAAFDAAADVISGKVGGAVGKRIGNLTEGGVKAATKAETKATKEVVKATNKFNKVTDGGRNMIGSKSMIARENLAKAKGGAQVARGNTVRAQMVNSATKGATGEIVNKAAQNSFTDKVKNFFGFN